MTTPITMPPTPLSDPTAGTSSPPRVHHSPVVQFQQTSLPLPSAAPRPSQPERKGIMKHSSLGSFNLSPNSSPISSNSSFPARASPLSRVATRSDVAPPSPSPMRIRTTANGEENQHQAPQYQALSSPETNKVSMMGSRRATEPPFLSYETRASHSEKDFSLKFLPPR